MFYSLLIIAIIGGGIYSLSHWRKLPESERKGFLKKAILWSSAIVILILVLAGRAPWLMGILAAVLALVARAAQLVPYIAIFKKMLGGESNTANNESSVAKPPDSTMSRRDAADILGIEETASRDEVRMAHKKLIQKLHPDRGGSDMLAKQINTAKDVLLG